MVVLVLLPVLQQQLVLRVWAEKGGKKENCVNKESSILILRALLN